MNDKKINIQLSNGQYKALLVILENASKEASNCTCNDPCKEELSVFTHEEREAILTSRMGKKYLLQMKKEVEENVCSEQTWEQALAEGYGLFNMDHIDYLISIIKSYKNLYKTTKG